MDVRIGVIGTGIMGADHVRTLATSVRCAQVVAVCDLDQERARAAVAGLGDIRIAEKPTDVVAAEDVDAVVVASHDDTHEELVLACLDAGKPVLCEKPLTPTPDGSLRIVAAESALGRRLVSVGFMRRYDPGYVAVKNALRQGAVDAPLMFHCVHRNAHARPNLPSSALISGSAIHEIDVARWLFEEEITRVTVHRSRPSGRVVGDTSDPLLLVMETASGVLVDVEVFVNAQYGYDVRAELVGESGTLSVDDPEAVVLRTARARSTRVFQDWRDRFADAYRLELQDWVAGVAAGEQRGATAWDGYAAAAVAQAGVQALETGTPSRVHLEPRPRLYQRLTDQD
jgi:myo-inositol 2-dehydrogenase/D-chiro-inositol 1-dehydrogenase